ncbi:MAG: TraB/GumN family protein [Alphaproteobacteria bacterium]|nr:TraB/GumN family protein [Alphaproteobacteria bacterium]
MRLILSFLLTFLGVAPVAAQVSCDGTDIWPTLPQKQRAQLENIVAKDVFAAGRFFKVEKDGKTSYLFGTMHAPPTGKLRLPGMVVSELKKSKTLLVEVTDPVEKAFFRDLKQHKDLFQNKADNNFSQYFSKDEWALIKKATRRGGVSDKLLKRARPWYIYLLMSTLGCDGANQSDQPVMDVRIQQIGNNAGLNVRSLETPLDGIKAMQGFSPEEYAMMIKAEIFGLAQSDPGDAYVTRVNMYRRGDIQLIWQYQLQIFAGLSTEAGVEVMTEFLEGQILGSRNANWLPSIMKALKKGNVFVAVGALHLGGKYGLMRSLQKDGYSVTRIKFVS